MNRKIAVLSTLVFAPMWFLHAAERMPVITVGPNVLVSEEHPELFHAELWFTADPSNPKHLMGGSMAYDLKTDTNHTIAYVSLDGGSTWEATIDAAPSVDPACAYGPDGTAYFVHLNRSKGGGMEVFRSKDGGMSWRKPVIVTYLDREFITVDDTGGPYHNRVYINAHEPGDKERKSRVLSLFYSTNGGGKWSDLVYQPGPAVGVKTPANGVVLSDGTFVSLFVDISAGAKAAPEDGLSQLSGWLGIATSTDGGRSINEPVKIADWYFNLGARHLAYIPFLAVDRSKSQYHNRLYAVWADTRSGRAEIHLSSSADKGKTWSDPKVVNDDAPRGIGKGPDHLHPGVAVNEHGIVGVSWYDRRAASDNLGWDARFAASIDGGRSFTPSVVVSEATYEPLRNQPSAVNEEVEREVLRTGAKYKSARWYFSRNGGDTTGIAVDAEGLFHAFWTDNRTGVAQVWTSTITVNKQ